MYVQFGCGHSAPEGWINFDASPTLLWERTPLVGRLYSKNSARFPKHVRYGDIVKGLPVPDDSCTGIYGSHVLEHLSLKDFHQALSNCKRLLRLNGVIRVIVPDLESAARTYLRGLDGDDEYASIRFLEGTYLGRASSPNGPLKLIYEAFRTSAHLWMWDRRSLAAALRDHGFRSIRQCDFGDAADKMFQRVEDRGRFEGAVAIEACK